MLTIGSCMGTIRVCFRANGGSMGATGGCMSADRVCLGYCKPDEGYWGG